MNNKGFFSDLPVLKTAQSHAVPFFSALFRRISRLPFSRLLLYTALSGNHPNSPDRLGKYDVKNNLIIAGFEKCFPETGVNTYQGLSSMETLRVISGKMAPFVRAMLESGEYDEFEPGMALDLYQLLPEDYDRFIRGANCEAVWFITSDVTPEERFRIQKQYDTEKDYTFYKSDEELREGAVSIVEQSVLIREQCERLGLPYYETAHDRERVFERFLRDFGF